MLHIHIPSTFLSTPLCESTQTKTITVLNIQYSWPTYVGVVDSPHTVFLDISSLVCTYISFLAWNCWISMFCIVARGGFSGCASFNIARCWFQTLQCYNPWLLRLSFQAAHRLIYLVFLSSSFLSHCPCERINDWHQLVTLFYSSNWILQENVPESNN